MCLPKPNQATPTLPTLQHPFCHSQAINTTQVSFYFSSFVFFFFLSLSFFVSSLFFSFKDL
jgi:hypothetical protein